MTLLRLTFFGLLVFMAMPTPNLAGNLSRQRLFYREIPVAEARRGMSKNIRARKAKQTDLQSTGNSSLMLQKILKIYYIIPMVYTVHDNTIIPMYVCIRPSIYGQ